jgi:hypothetical protein
MSIAVLTHRGGRAFINHLIGEKFGIAGYHTSSYRTYNINSNAIALLRSFLDLWW